MVLLFFGCGLVVVWDCGGFGVVWGAFGFCVFVRSLCFGLAVVSFTGMKIGGIYIFIFQIINTNNNASFYN